MITTIALILAATALRPHGAEAQPRDVAVRPLPPTGAPTATLTIDAMPYARTVTCGSYTLTGSASGAGAVSWSASPSGESGSCTGTTSWSCVVSVAPDASGEGVEVITVSQSGGASDTETIGFYVSGAHSCFLSQSVDGSYNSTLADLDAVATWENLGSSALDVTQGVSSKQPTFRTGIVGGQPVVRCDGGDRLTASTASNWTFMHDGTTWDGEYIASRTSSAVGIIVTNSNNATSCAATATASHCGRYVNSPNALSFQSLQNNGTANVAANSTANSAGTGVFNYLRSGMTPTLVSVSANTSDATSARATPSGTTTGALSLCWGSGEPAGQSLTGDLFRVLIYQSALSSTQRGINQAVDEWALGGALPVTP